MGCQQLQFGMVTSSTEYTNVYIGRGQSSECTLLLPSLSSLLQEEDCCRYIPLHSGVLPQIGRDL